MLQLTTPPTQEVLTLEQAKSHARIFIEADDDLITDLISAARQKFESDSGYLLAQAGFTWTVKAQTSQSIDLPRRPVNAVISVGDLDEDAYTLTVDAASGIGTVTLTSGNFADNTEIVFNAGNSAAPALAKFAVNSLIAHWYNTREAFVEAQLRSVPAGYESIVRTFRIA